MYGTPSRCNPLARFKKLPVAYGGLEDFILEYDWDSELDDDQDSYWDDDDDESSTLEGLIWSRYYRAESKLQSKFEAEIQYLHLEDDIWDSIESPDQGKKRERELTDRVHRNIDLVRNAIAVSVTCLSGRQEKKVHDSLLANLLALQDELDEQIAAEFEELRLVSAETEAAEDQRISEKEKQQIEESVHEAELAAAKRAELLAAQQAAQQEGIRQIFAKREAAAAKRKNKKLWSHLTISRDQTAASDFKRELLLSLRSTSLAIRTSALPEVFFPFEGPPPPMPAHIRAILERQSAAMESHTAPSASNHHLRSAMSPGQSRLAATPPRMKVPNSKAPATYSRESTGSGMVASPAGKHAKVPSQSISEQRSGSEDEEDDDEADGDGDGESDENLRNIIRKLEEENRKLKGSTAKNLQVQTFYFLKQQPRDPDYVAHLDEPAWYVDADGDITLKSRSPISDITAYLEHRQNTSFVVSRFYDLEKQEKEVREAAKVGQVLPLPEASYEDILLKAQPVIDAAEAFAKLQPTIEDDFPGLDMSERIAAPYLPWYRYRSPTALDQLEPKHQEMMALLTTWIEDNYRELYEKVQDQLERGVISPETVQFLIQPGDVVVSKEKKDLVAVIARSWPILSSQPLDSSGPVGMRWGKKLSVPDKLPTWTWSFDTRQYLYDGSFYTQLSAVDTVIRAKSFKDEVAIKELSAYPLRFASEEWKTTLERRGKTFWSCRKRRLVGYEDDRGFYGSSDRFMTDFDTYAQIHSDEFAFKRTYPYIDDPDCDRMDSQVLEANDPPAAPDIYVFPNSIVAYNLRNKKWIDLEVDKIREVRWNKASFDHLVVDHETKELVQALVTNQIALEKGTDIIESKGNGLIILLHGGPGTGKTFTAESVAELAEKPLFRVTCGDIGTKPEDVEKYLESVLHLGKSWGCVVLLDEAEVFLEQRQLTDLDRNALVSVFLRVLEYYEGILILTSNRVATFDEAFKSRIQLSLHYEDLTEGQRFQIWRNFLSRLKGLEDKTGEASGAADAQGKAPVQESMGINFGEIECYIGELAKYEMNGRQIRNAITTARQLAAFKKEQMSLKHLKHVIGVSNKFDKYLKGVTDGLGDGWGTKGGGYS